MLISHDSSVSTAVMMMKSQTPLVMSNLGGQKKLHCQFAIDHKGPNFSLEWHKRGERVTLFSHTSRTRQTEGGGVDLKGLAGGDASYNLPFTKVSNEGMYVCSVSVAPLSASLDISLHIQGEEVIELAWSSWLSVRSSSSDIIADSIFDLNLLRVSPRLSQRWPHPQPAGGRGEEGGL